MSFAKNSIGIAIAVLSVVGCSEKIGSQKIGLKVGSPIVGIYMERFFSGDNGWPDKNLFFGCDSVLWSKLKLRRGSFDPGAVNMVVPCHLLQEIDDTLATYDSLNSFNDPPQVWIMSRLRNSDTGITANQKMFTYNKGKIHLWWMLDHVLKTNPGAFKTAKVGDVSLPPRDFPPDSAWLDTVKQGLF